MKSVRKKIFVYIALSFILIITSGVLAQQLGLNPNAQKAIEDVMKKKGMSSDKIESIEQLDFNSLPEQIKIENIDNTQLAVYEVKPLEGESFFVITASDNLIQKTETTTRETKFLLNFGYNGIMESSGFLRTTTGVETNLEKGYVMIRKGSITGLSTNLESVSGTGKIELVIYKNGEPVGLRNSMVIESESKKVLKDYDTLSKGTVNFEQGDVISIYVKSQGDIVWKDVITLIEITE